MTVPCGIRVLPLLLTIVVILGAPLADAADPNKTLRIALPRAESGFDPAMATEVFSGAVIGAIVEPLLTFDYLARPVKVVPLTASALPEITDNGTTYTFKIRPGIVFSADPAFKGKPRELTADDYVFAIKRIADPANRSPNVFYVVDKIVGLGEAVTAASKPNAAFDYSVRIEGLEATDRYTLRIRLKSTDYTFGNVMALSTFSAVAREVVDAYPGNLRAHPVGTGPFVLKARVPASRMTLEANPAFREMVWDFTPGADPADKALAAAMRGKKLPQVGVIVINVMEEARTRWLAFQNDELDLVTLPPEFAPLGIEQ